jgi:hypothetical protein
MGFNPPKRLSLSRERLFHFQAADALDRMMLAAAHAFLTTFAAVSIINVHVSVLEEFDFSENLLRTSLNALPAGLT